MVNAQSDTITEKQIEKQIEKAKKDSTRESKVALGQSLISPLIVPGYTPELGGLLAVGGLWSFKTKKTDSLIQRSSLPFTFSLTTTGATVIQARPTTYWLKDKLRINAELWYKDMPDNYWGVGAENAKNNPKSDSTTAYQRQWWWINPQFLYQFKENYFVGLNVDYNFTQGTNPSVGVASDPDYIKYNDSPMNSGLGVILRHDSRDVPVNAWKGKLIDVSATFYSDAFGGDNNYQMYLLDYRQYKQVGKKGRTLAWQIKGRFGLGDVPYGEMGQLGNPFDLRGYTWGQYRDKNLFFILPEYRHTFYKQNGELSKHGAVVWAATGSVFGANKDEDGTSMTWLPNLGVGYRLELQPRMNLRLDIGMANGATGIYFNFNEAF